MRRIVARAPSDPLRATRSSRAFSGEDEIWWQLKRKNLVGQGGVLGEPWKYAGVVRLRAVRVFCSDHFRRFLRCRRSYRRPSAQLPGLWNGLSRPTYRRHPYRRIRRQARKNQSIDVDDLMHGSMHHAHGMLAYVLPGGYSGADPAHGAAPAAGLGDGRRIRLFADVHLGIRDAEQPGFPLQLAAVQRWLRSAFGLRCRSARHDAPARSRSVRLGVARSVPFRHLDRFLRHAYAQERSRFP